MRINASVDVAAKKGSFNATCDASSVEKIFDLSATLPSISEPKKALFVMQAKRRLFKEINESLQAEHERSTSEFRDEWELLQKRTTFICKRKKKSLAKPTKSLLELLYETDDYRREAPSPVFWKEVKNDIAPGARMSGSLSTVGETAVLLYGGEAHTTLSDSWLFSLGTMEWTALHFSPRMPEGRTGHTATVFGKQVVAVGGETALRQLPRQKQMLPTALALSTEDNVSGEMHTMNPYIGMRKFHCAIDSGRHLFVHGGYGEKNEMLDDPAALNLSSLRWRPAKVNGDGPGPRAYHAAAIVQWNGRARGSGGGVEAGMYVFGGLDRNHEAKDTLHVLKPSARGWTWSSVETIGDKPAARYQHTMTYFPELCFLAVFGGRQNSHSGSGYRCFGEVHLLHLETSRWSKADLHGSLPESRCGHMAAGVGSKLVVFGGIHNSHFCGASLFVAELDREKAEALTAEEERRKDLLRRVEQFKLQHRLQKGVRLSRKHIYHSTKITPNCSPVPDLITMLYQKVHSTNSDDFAAQTGTKSVE